MANQPYGTYGSYVSSRLTADPYSSVHNSEVPKYPSSYDYRSALYSNPSELRTYSTLSGLSSAGLSLGVKRSADALYSQNDLGGHNTIGHNDALLSSNSMFKHPRIESSSQLPLHPQRPGEKDCTHYMLTRACKFGEACKFDHPMWVPEGGIPNWKEGLVAPAVEVPPERPGEPDCPFYMKTQLCKFGSRCKFNHPKNKLNVPAVGDGTETVSLLPERPGEPICAYYSKTGNCKFGATCKFHHPKDIQIQPTEQNAGSADQAATTVKNFVPFTPALFQNSKGLPVRPGETDCPFYLKTGSCKYSTTCRYNHPERNEINPLLNQLIMPSASGLPVSLFNAAANLFPGLDPLFSKPSLGAVPNLYPQRPGQTECDYYMKTGKCTFAERCKYHHPIDRSAINVAAPQAQATEPNVKLTLAGLPRREGAVACPFYMKTSTCKFAVTCKFDHPPPGEAVAKATTTKGSGSPAETSDDDA